MRGQRQTHARRDLGKDIRVVCDQHHRIVTGYLSERSGDVRSARPIVRDPSQPDRSNMYGPILQHLDPCVSQGLPPRVRPHTTNRDSPAPRRRPGVPLETFEFLGNGFRLDKAPSADTAASIRPPGDEIAQKAQSAQDSPHWSSQRWSALCRAPHAATRYAGRSKPRSAGRTSTLEAPCGDGEPPAYRVRSRTPTRPPAAVLKR